METKKAIEERRSIRKYLPDKIDEKILIEGIKYGTLSGSAHNKQPWKFKILNDKEKNDIAQMLYNKTKDIEEHTGPHTSNIIKESPNIILVFYDEKEGFEKEMDLLSIGSCIENIILYFTDIGLGTLWIGNTYNIKTEIKEYFKTNLEPISCIAVGKKNQNPNPRPRKDINSILL